MAPVIIVYTQHGNFVHGLKCPCLVLFPAIPLIRWQCQKSECLLLLEIPHRLFTPVKSATVASFGIFLHDA